MTTAASGGGFLDAKTLREQVEKKTGKTPEQLFEERETRVKKAKMLQEPDRVPVLIRMGDFPTRYAGLTRSAVYYEPALYKQAILKTLVDFEPDIFQHLQNATTSGLVMTALGTTHVHWPGGDLAPDDNFQFATAEWMKADEYDLFITDPTDFMLRCYLPRTLSALEPLSRIPPVAGSLGDITSGLFRMIPTYTSPEFQKIGQILLKAKAEQEKFNQIWKGFDSETTSLGFPTYRYPGGVGSEPFDLFASRLRGLQGVIFDMYRRPEKLIAACDKVVDWRLARTKPADPNAKGHPRTVYGGSFHFSSDRFLSKKQFATFSWPSWKRALLATIDMGFIPVIFGEGKIDNRLEFLLELPKGKFWMRFDDADLARAKEVLGNHCCLCGNVPSSLIGYGSTQEVEDYTRNMINVGGKGGGFIVACNSMDDAKPANVKAMIDAVKKFGRY